MDDLEDVEDVDDEEDLDELGVEQSTPEKRARHAITGRGVTLQMLMADGIIKAGEGVLSLEYLVCTCIVYVYIYIVDYVHNGLC